MEQIKSNNFKTTVIMENLINRVKNIFSKPVETKEEVVAEKKEAIINLDKEFNLGIINNKEFYHWLKQEIKSLAAEQKVAKRDRKDTKHPCPEERKYNPGKACDVVRENGWNLRASYAIYYILRHKRDFKWENITMKSGSYSWSWSCGWGLPDGFKEAIKDIDPNFYEGWGYSLRQLVVGLVKKYVKEVNEGEQQKALCNC